MIRVLTSISAYGLSKPATIGLVTGGLSIFAEIPFNEQALPDKERAPCLPLNSEVELSVHAVMNM